MDTLNHFSNLLQNSLSPIILISGVGLLLLSLTNKLGRTTDISRGIVKELEKETNGGKQESKKRQLRILYKRSMYLRNSIFAISISILCSSLIIFNLLIMNLFEIKLVLMSLMLFVINVLSIVVSALYLLMDVSLTLKALKYEITSFVK